MLPLPENLRLLFWDVDFDSLNTANRDFVMRRLLDSQNLDAIRFLLKTEGPEAIREWIESKNGAGLSPKVLAYWGLITQMPESRVNELVEQARQSVWHKRTSR